MFELVRSLKPDNSALCDNRRDNLRLILGGLNKAYTRKIANLGKVEGTQYRKSCAPWRAFNPWPMLVFPP